MEDVQEKKEESTGETGELKRMTFGEHLEELRKRLIRALLALIVVFGAAMVYYEPLVKIMVLPHNWAMELAEVPQDQWQFLAGTYQGPFFAVIKMCFIVGLFGASPIIAYQMWAFVAAGLYKHERKYVYIFALPSFLLFVGGCLFGYFILIKFGLYGLTQFQIHDVVSPTFTFGDYLSLVMLLTVVMGIVFELPLFMVFFAKIGLVSPSVYTKWWKYAIVILFLVSAMLTPPDPFTQLMMAGPLLLLYGLGIVVSRMVAPRKPETTHAG